jgi:3-deoxy-D-manno-octulosonic-acid transferase
MAHPLDALYALGLTAASPWLAWRAFSRGRDGYRRLLRGHPCPPRPEGDTAPLAWFHGVSLGEVNLLAPVIKAFRARHPGWRVGVTATTPAGMQEAKKRFAADSLVACFSWDFTWQIERVFTAWNPSLVILAESQLWPNWLRLAKRRGIPVAVINGRMSPRSAAAWARRPRLARRIFPLVHSWMVQDESMAGHLASLGVAREAVEVTGSVKFDGARGDRNLPLLAALREQFPVPPGAPVWVAGSTQESEEPCILDAYGSLSERFPNLRLVLVPRQPDAFEASARRLRERGIPFLRRSQGVIHPAGSTPRVLLLDTIGELSAAWGLATVGFVGGSLDGKRGGQSPIEPAAFGVPVCFGPHVWNFRDITAQLLAAGGAHTIPATGDIAANLAACVADWLAHPSRAAAMGQAAREFVARQQGATDRTLTFLQARGLTPSPASNRQAG